MDVDDVHAFLRGNCTVCGITVQYLFTADNKVYPVMARGKPGKRVIKKLIEQTGAVAWTFSWAWAPKAFEIDGVVVKTEKDIDLLSNLDVLTAWHFGRSLDLEYA